MGESGFRSDRQSGRFYQTNRAMKFEVHGVFMRPIYHPKSRDQAAV